MAKDEEENDERKTIERFFWFYLEELDEYDQMRVFKRQLLVLVQRAKRLTE
jgi:hypothetical protein